MRIHSNQSLYLLLDKWRGNLASISFDGAHISTSGMRASSVGLAALIKAPVVKSKWIGSELSLEISADKRMLRVRSRDEARLKRFAHEIEQAWRAFNIEQLNTRSEEITGVLELIADLSLASFYPAACIIQPTLTLAQELDTKLLSKLNEQAIGGKRFAELAAIRGFVASPKAIRKDTIAKFEKQQLEHWSDFFDNFEKNPLTPEQRLAVVADEDATLVLAGAGSGKTSVITAKAGYLIKSGVRKPEEVLLLAFARDAAAEMSERIKERCGEPVEARTFHALAYDIIGQVEGGKPALAAHATDDKAFLVLIRDILVKLANTISEASKAIIGWFSFARLLEKSEWDFKKKHDFYTYLEMLDLRTLQGEKVKSYEELMIANWLYENGVEYEYEPDYEFDTSNSTKRNYCPDFRLIESGVYLEHFGVRKQQTRHGEEILVTAPWVDRDSYIAGMEWKRGVHIKHETTLIETFSYERQEGCLLESLAKKIEPHEALRPRPR